MESPCFIESYKAPANMKIMFWPLALCDTHTYWVSHSQSPTWCHLQSVLVTLGLDPTDWLASNKILSYSIQVLVSLSSSGINGSVTSWLLPGSHPPTCRRLENVRRYRSLADLPLTVRSEAVTIITGSVMFSWHMISNIICGGGVGMMNVREPMAM